MIFNFQRHVEANVMSTRLIIKAYAPLPILKQAVSLAKQLEAQMSMYQQTSEISAINAASGLHSIHCSDTTCEAIEDAIAIATATQGVFDPTIGALSYDTYGFGTQHQQIPHPKACAEATTLVNYKDIEIQNSDVFLKTKGMRIDLGGIGKGFAVDKIITFFKSKGVKAALVSLGGEIHAYGKVWTIGIAHPRENRLLCLLETFKKDTGVTTSGDYERFLNSPEHHHILNPKSGESVNIYSSLTLLSNRATNTQMDALNTALFQMPIQTHHKLLSQYGIETLCVDKALTTSLSPQLCTLVKSIKFL